MTPTAGAKRSLRELLLTKGTSTRPPWQDSILRKCALLREFDEALFAAVFAEEVPPGERFDFAALTAMPEVVPVPGNPGAFYVRGDSRSALLAAWESDPDGLRDFSRRMWVYYKDGSPLDQLAQMLFASPRDARAFAAKLYDAADRAGDLSACDAQLRILRNRSELLSQFAPDLFEFLQDREQYLRSRVLFVEDWTRSRHYLERQRLTRAADAFLRSPRKWLLQICAKGGFGKTAFLRWFISRRLLVAGEGTEARWPVARIDFDRVNLATIATAPCLLLVRAADQLDRQVERGVGASLFRTFLLDNSRYLPALEPAPIRASTQVHLSLSDNEAAEIEKAFCRQLASTPALLVLDTVEEMVLHRPQEWLESLRLLGRVHDACPGLKVILSGRYDIRSRADFNAWTSLPATRRGMATLTVNELSGAESVEYLTRVRLLRPTFSTTRVPRPAQGHPFKLTLFADRVGAGGTFSLKDLSELQHADVQYLIERIIERVPDCELQWVLRYAVVPNELTKDFLDQVLLPHVRREASRSDRDRPHDNLPAGADVVRTSTSWSPCQGAFETDRLWEELRKYASSSSWISLEGDIPKLQPELVVPMRYLLQSQQVYADVHHDAALWFEARIAPDLMDAGLYLEQRMAARTPDEAAQVDRDLRERAAAAGDFAVEALFHHFQAEGATAASHWHRYMASAFALFPDVRGTIAASLLGGDYLDDEGRPRPHQRTPTIIDLETVAEAHFELSKTLSAELLHETRRADPDQSEEAMMNRVEGHLDAIRRIEKALGRTVIGSERIEVEAQVLSHLGRDGEALTVLDVALADAEPVTAVRLMTLKGNLLARRSAEAAQPVFDAAVNLARTALHDRGALAATIRTVQGVLERDRGALDGALRYFEDSVLSTVSGGGSTSELIRRVERLVDVLDQAARWSAIPRWLEYVEAHADNGAASRAFVTDQRCRLDLALMRVSSVIPNTDNPVHALWTASRLALLHHRGAIDAYQLATRLFERAQNTVGAQGCEIERLEFIVRVIGNFNEARTLASRLDPTGPNWLRGQMALIELLRPSARDRAVQQWKRVSGEARTTAALRDRVLAMAEALASGLEPVAASDDLATLLAQVTPPDARIALLRPFEAWVPEAPGMVREPQPALLAVLPDLQPSDPDFVLRAVPLARALQFSGAADRGRDLLASALAALTPAAGPLIARRLLAAARHLDLVVEDRTIENYLAGLRNSCSEYPGLILATHVEQAEWWIEKGNLAAASEALKHVAVPEGEPDQFVCRFMALQSRLADDDMEANLWGSQARGLAARLGLPDGLLDLREVRVDDKPVYASPFPLRAHVVDVRHPAEYELIVTTRRIGGSEEIRQVSLKTNSHLIQILDSRGSTGALEMLLGDRLEAASVLRGVLPLPPAGDPPAGLLLAFDDDAMAGLPWEWVTDGTPFAFVSRTTARDPMADTVRWMQSALTRLGTPIIVDGVAGPQTYGALTSFDSAHHVLESGVVTSGTIRKVRELLARNPIAVVARSYEFERSYRTGYGAFGIDAVKIWQAAAPLCSRVEPGDTSALLGGLTSLRPDVIHITLAVSQTGSDLRLASSGPSEGQGSPTSVALTPGALSRMLESSFGPSERPFVILDLPHSGSRAETVKLLYLRNQYAHQLSALGRTRGVLATGLAGAQSLAVVQALVKGVTAGEDPAALVRSVAPLTADAPSALFVSDPSIPVW